MRSKLGYRAWLGPDDTDERHGLNCHCDDCDGIRADMAHEARQEARAEARGE